MLLQSASLDSHTATTSRRRFDPLIYSPLIPKPPKGGTELSETNGPKIDDFRTHIEALTDCGTPLRFHVSHDTHEVLPIAEIFGDPVGPISARVAYALMNDRVFPTEVMVDEVQLHSSKSLGSFHQPDELDEPFTPTMTLQFRSVSALNRSAKKFDAWVIAHEIRHRFFGRLRAQGIFTPYDGAIDSRLEGPYVGRASFEELYNQAKDAQKCARILALQGTWDPTDRVYCRLLACLQSGQRIGSRLFEFGQTMLDFISLCPQHIWGYDAYRGANSIFFSAKETLSSGEADQTNFTVPLCFANGSSFHASERTVVTTALRNLSTFAKNYTNYFEGGLKATDVEGLYKARLLYPKDPDLRRGHRNRLHRMYAFGRFSNDKAKSSRFF